MATVRRWRLGAAGLALAAGAFAAGAGAARVPAAQGAPHAALRTGEFWATLSPREKQLWLAGFIAGAAAEQARAEARAAGTERDSLAVSSGTVARLLRARALRYRFATPVYSSQLDDYYWWDNHVPTPLVDAMIRINDDMLKQQEVPQ
ncbi:MAG TPA: hypothetical protein VFS05_06760 [Gemmatimonadaceae bacterium]|nr:hypothetical protein [Gemmatimonadaceae bacterium]